MLYESIIYKILKIFVYYYQYNKYFYMSIVQKEFNSDVFSTKYGRKL